MEEVTPLKTARARKSPTPSATLRAPAKRSPRLASLPVETREQAVPPQKGLILSKILRDEIVPVIQKHGVSRILLGRAHLSADQTPPGITLSSRGSLGPEVRRRGLR